MNRFMKIVPILAVPIAAAVGFAVPGCDQPKIPCAGGHGEFAAKLTLKSGSGMCATLKGTKFGVQSYVTGMPGARPSFEKPPVAIKADDLGQLMAEYEQEVPDEKSLSAVGNFADAVPAADGFCKVGAMTPVTVSLPAKPASVDAMGMMKPALPARMLKYEWSDVRFYVSAAAPGTQFTGKLKYTDNDCTAEYDVVALAPAHGCELTMRVTGPNGMPMNMRTGMPDQSACSPCSDVSKMRSTGSGIAPDVDTICDPDILLCVPRNAPPSLLPAAVQCAPPKPAGA